MRCLLALFIENRWLLGDRGFTIDTYPHDELVQARIDAIVERVHAQGGRVTPQRIAILGALLSEDHPSIDAIYARVRPAFPMTSLGTVYKTIRMLQEMGEVLELGLGPEASRYDALNPAPHAHLICSDCGRILDIHVEGLDAVLGRIPGATGGAVANGRVDLWGLCPACREARAKESPR